jgi:transposase
LSGLKFDQPTLYIVPEEAMAAVEAATARRDRLEAQIEVALPEWSLAPVVNTLQALRGIGLVAAATLVAKLGDMTGFTNPRNVEARYSLLRVIARREATKQTP